MITADITTKPTTGIQALSSWFQEMGVKRRYQDSTPPTTAVVIPDHMPTKVVTIAIVTTSVRVGSWWASSGSVYRKPTARNAATTPIRIRMERDHVGRLPTIR